MVSGICINMLIKNKKDKYRKLKTLKEILRRNSGNYSAEEPHMSILYEWTDLVST